MPLIPNQAWRTQDQALFARQEGTGLISTYSTLYALDANFSTLTVEDSATEYGLFSSLSTGYADIHDLNTSTIFAYEVFIDNQGLTATPSELLLNGIPIATTANLSSIQDWALFPAVSTLDMANFNIINVQNIQAVSSYTSTVSSLVEVADAGFFSTLSTGNATGGNYAPSSLWGQASSYYQDLISTISSFGSDNITCSTLTAQNFISTLDLEVSTINGHILTESSITTSSIITDSAQVSSLVSFQLSSVIGNVTLQLASSINLNPSFSLGGVNLGLGSLFPNLGGAALGGLGVLVGGAALGTGIAALTQGRQTNYINSNAYELVNTTTQLQVSTLGTPFSTIYRFVSSPAENVPGEEIFISSVYPAGLAIRSMSDPLNTVSTPNSTIQAFGQWVSLAETLDLVSTFNTLQTSTLSASTITLAGQMIIQPSTLRSGVYMPFDATNGTGVVAVGLSTSVSVFEKYAAFVALQSQPFGAATKETFGVLETQDNEVSFQYADLQLGRALFGGNNNYGASPSGYITGDTAGNLTAVGLSFNTSNAVVSSLKLSPSSILYSQTTDSEVVVGTAADPNDLGQLACSALRLASSVTSSNGILAYNANTDRAIFVNSALQPKTLAYTTDSNVNFSSINNVSSLSFAGISTVTFATAAAAGGAGQTAGRLVMSGCDLDVGQNDIWAQQIRLGAGNPTNAQTEIIFYDAAAGQRGLQTALQDRTIRVVSTINGTQGGYLLDTGINPPFFSTINAGTSTALFAFFPSSVNSTIGASTLSVIPNPIFVAAAASLSSQQVLAANTPLALDLGTLGINTSGFTLQRSTITVPVAGTYQLSPSIQFNTTTGGSQTVDFWVTKNGVDIQNSASRISVANNAQQIGTVVLCDTAAAGDQYGLKIASSDANMSAGFFQSTVTTPYTRPAIPSIILNLQRIA